MSKNFSSKSVNLKREAEAIILTLATGYRLTREQRDALHARLAEVDKLLFG